MAARSHASATYRFGFNGQEKDDEIAGQGNINAALFWEYDTRLGRRWNLDPKGKAPISPYSAFDLNPIVNVDVLGDTTYLYSHKGQFLGMIPDKLDNQVVFYKNDAIVNEIHRLESSGSVKSNFNKWGLLARDYADAILTTSTAAELKKYRQTETSGERGGLLYLPQGSKELKIWECTDCGSTGNSFSAPLILEKAPTNILENAFVQWHTHDKDWFQGVTPSQIQNEQISDFRTYGAPIGMVVSKISFAIYPNDEVDGQLNPWALTKDKTPFKYNVRGKEEARTIGIYKFDTNSPKIKFDKNERSDK